jgi:hypothetical protein
MAGRKGTAVKLQAPKERAKSKRRRKAHRMLVAELVEESKLYEMGDLYQNPVGVLNAMQLMLDRAMALWRLAANEVDKLRTENLFATSVDEQGNEWEELTKWVAWEQALRNEVFEMAARMQALNVDERLVRVEEVKTELLGRALVNAARKAGLDEDTQRALGTHLREELALLQPGPKPGDAQERNQKAIEGRVAA